MSVSHWPVAVAGACRIWNFLDEGALLREKAVQAVLPKRGQLWANPQSSWVQPPSERNMCVAQVFIPTLCRTMTPGRVTEYNTTLISLSAKEKESFGRAGSSWGSDQE